MKDLPKRVLFGAIVTLLLLSCTAPVQAFDTGSVGGRPAYPQPDNERSQNIFVRTIDPGATVNDGIEIISYRDDERTVAVTAVDARAATDGSFSCKQASEEKSGVGSWIKLSTEKIVLGPQGTQIIPFTITVPKDASPGEHGGCISIQDQANVPTGDGAGVRLGFRTAIRVAITVSGDIVKEAVIERVTISRNNSGKYVVSPVIRNKGNVSLELDAHAQLNGRFGEQTPRQDAEFPVMNGQATAWNFEFDRPFWGGWYKARIAASYNDNVADGVGENTGKSKKSLGYTSKYFFILPSKKGMMVEAAIIAALLLIPGFVIFLLRRRKKRAQWQIYIVAPTDTLQSLAQERGTKWRRIAKFNKIRSPYIIQTGQKILVPPMDGAQAHTPAAVYASAAPLSPAHEGRHVDVARPATPHPQTVVHEPPKPVAPPAPVRGAREMADDHIDATPAYVQAVLDPKPYSSRPMTYRGSMSYDPGEIAEQIVAKAMPTKRRRAKPAPVAAVSVPKKSSVRKTAAKPRAQSVRKKTTKRG